jgi:protease-4
MTPAQTAAFSAWMDRIYNGFVARVAEGRRLPVAQVQAIAKGHIWTGVQAKSLGLIDEIGGFQQAVDRAKALAGISGEARLKSFSGPSSPFEAVLRMFGASADGVRLMAEAGELARDPQARALMDSLHDARLRQNGAAVLAPLPSFSGR